MDLPASVVVNLLFAPTSVLLPLYASLLSKSGAAALGFLESTLGIGMVAGSLVVGIVAAHWAKGRLAVGGFTGFSLAMLAFGLAPKLGWAGLALGLAGAGLVLVDTPLLTIIQEETPPDQQGRVFGVLMAAGTAAQPLGMLAGGGLGDLLGVRPVLVGTGLLFTLLSLGTAAIPAVRNAR